MTRRHLGVAGVAVLVGLAGCGYETPMTSTQVDVTGSVTAGGKPVKDAYVYFHPTGGAAQPAALKLGADGTFSGKVVAGKYSWYLTTPEAAKGADRQKSEAGLKGIRAAFLEANMDRQIDVSASNAKLDLTTN